MLRLETTQASFYKANADVPMPNIPDGAFKLTIPEGVYSVTQRGAPGAGPLSHLGGYYVKGLSIGRTDLSKELLTIGASMPDELINYARKVYRRPTGSALPLGAPRMLHAAARVQLGLESTS